MPLFILDIIPRALQAQQSYLSPEQEAELNTLQLWFLSGASLLLVFLVLWQILAGNRRGRVEEAIRREQEDARAAIQSSQEQAKNQADAILKEAQLKAKEALMAAREEGEKEKEKARAEFRLQSERLNAREDSLESRLQLLQERLEELDRRGDAFKEADRRLQEERQGLEEARKSLQEERARLAGTSVEEARRALLEELRREMTAERAVLVRRQQEEGRQLLTEQGREILLASMERCASTLAQEDATSTIALPNEEMKGRIIGKDGRNIRALEAATGTSILVDEAPQTVVISCFDPLRREVARRVLEKLVDDGRIHPSRVEELVETIRQELQERMRQKGEEAAQRLSLVLPEKLLDVLGRLEYRHSFSQNVLQHSLEVGTLAGMLAAEMGLSQEQARRAGLLHDIGKALPPEGPGGHAALGAELLRSVGEDPVVVNAVAAHHNEVPMESGIAVIVQVCDAVSAARPGARSETTELFLRRLEALERIGGSFAGVESCHVLQAGREIRVLVQPQEVSQEQSQLLARELARRIQAEVRYPGQIRVTVIRETRAVEYAC
ncbi:MAG: ribonuclease Y [Oligosphaeraceae bacterium]